jgi:hypothetical protein
MNVLNIADLDKTLTDHETSAYNWLCSQSDSIEEQRKIAVSAEFQCKLYHDKVAGWIDTLSNVHISDCLDPVATLIPTGRWNENLGVTKDWLCKNHDKLRWLLGLHVEVKCLCFKDYAQYIKDKFYEMRSWLGRVIQYYMLYNKQLQINVYDDTFDVAVRASEMTFAGHPFNVIWVHDGVPKRLFVADKPKEKESWVTML